MREVVQIEAADAARAALHPTRVQLLDALQERKTCAELAAALELSPQCVNNHLKELVRVGLIRVAQRRAVRNLTESTYQAVGKAYRLSPRLVRPVERQARDHMVLHELLVTAEAIESDVVALLDRASVQEVPSLGFSVDLQLRSAAERSAFANDMLAALRPVVEKYSSAETSPHAYRLRLICYPTPTPSRKPTP